MFQVEATATTTAKAHAWQWCGRASERTFCDFARQQLCFQIKSARPLGQSLCKQNENRETVLAHYALGPIDNRNWDSWPIMGLGSRWTEQNWTECVIEQCETVCRIGHRAIVHRRSATKNWKQTHSRYITLCAAIWKETFKFEPIAAHQLFLFVLCAYCSFTHSFNVHYVLVSACRYRLWTQSNQIIWPSASSTTTTTTQKWLQKRGGRGGVKLPSERGHMETIKLELVAAAAPSASVILDLQADRTGEPPICWWWWLKKKPPKLTPSSSFSAAAVEQ